MINDYHIIHLTIIKRFHSIYKYLYKIQKYFIPYIKKRRSQNGSDAFHIITMCFKSIVIT